MKDFVIGIFKKLVIYICKMCFFIILVRSILKKYVEYLYLLLCVDLFGSFFGFDKRKSDIFEEFIDIDSIKLLVK